MSMQIVVKVLDEGLFIPQEAYENFGEIEVVRTSDSIVIQPKRRSRERIICSGTGGATSPHHQPPLGRSNSGQGF